MNAEYLPFILPFVASMIAIFVGPMIASRLQKRREEVQQRIGHSSMLDNYTGALDSAWNRINMLEKHLEKLEKEKEEMVRSLSQENHLLKVRVYDLEREVERLVILARVPEQRKDNGNNT